MKDKEKQGPENKKPKLQGAIESMAESDDSVELEVRLNNPRDRALHYIADVRAMIFDPATKRLRVQLSDKGREMPPGGMIVEPRFRLIDPHSEALIKIRLPKTIVKLTEGLSPTGEVRFEEHAVADAVEIKLELGWADVPYYKDPRDKSRGAQPISSWEQESLNIAFTPKAKRKKPR